jgi:hypothetical protein
MAVHVSYYGVSYYETGTADIFLGPNLVSFNRNRNYSAILATLQIASYALGV